MIARCALLLFVALGLNACSLKLKPNLNPFYDVVLQSNPKNAAALQAQGEYLIGQGQYKAAMKYFERLVKIEPQLARGWLGIGRCLLEDRQFKPAARAFQEAVKRQPSKEGYLGLASATLMGGNPAKARRLVKTIEEKYGAGTEIWRLRGDIDYVTGDWTQAQVDYQESLKLNPGQRELQDRLSDIQEFLTSSR